MHQKKRRFSLFPWRDDFRYQEVTPDKLPWIMRRHIITGAMGSTYGNLTTGMFLVAFGDTIGVTIFQWGVLGALCSFAITVQIFSAYAAARHGYRRVIWYFSEMANRILRGIGLAAAFILFGWGQRPEAAFAFVFLLSLASFFAAAAAPPWFSWLTDIIPERVHGSFMGRRDAWLAFVTLSFVIPASIMLDNVQEDGKIRVFALIFAIGLLLGIMDLIFHRYIPEPRVESHPPESLWKHILEPLRDRQFQPWLLFSTLWNFTVLLSASVCTVFFVEDLHIRGNFLIGSIVLIAIPLASTMLTSARMGALIDRLGVKPVLILSHFIWAILPAFWIAATPSTALFWLGICFALGGGAAAAAVNAGIKMMTRIPPPEHRTMYIAMTGCLSNLSGGLGALAGGWFLTAYEGHHWMFWGETFIPFHVLFAVSLLLRLLVWILLFPLKPPHFDHDK